MAENKALWKRVCMTDPKAVKPITGKQYSGNSPKPYWIVERLTDEFGPCGIGWGFKILNERIERFSDTDTLHIAVVQFWYVLDGKHGELEQIGQTKASYTSGAGKFILDEDAPKKSVTDALIKCASYLGFAGDIFSGRWDDSKYVAEAGKEWESRKREADDSVPKPTPKATPKAEQTAGTPGKWQISIKTEPDCTDKDYINIATEATLIALDQAKSQSDVMEIYKVNKVVFDKFKSISADDHKDLMAAFTQKKESFK